MPEMPHPGEHHGKVRCIGTSNFTVDDLARAQAVAPVASVQQANLEVRRARPERCAAVFHAPEPSVIAALVYADVSPAELERVDAELRGRAA